MNKTRTFAMPLLLLALMPAVYAQDVLRIATEGTFPPYSMRKTDGSLAGFDVDIAKALCQEMKAKCEIVANEFDGMIPGLLAKKFDLVVASMAITEERKRAIAFSDKYQGGYSTMLGLNGNKLDGTPAGMKGRTLAVQQGTIQANYARAKYAPAGVRISTYSTVENGLLDVLSGRADALMVDVGSAYELLKKPQGKKAGMFGPKLNDEKYFGTGSGIAMRKDDKDLLARVNTALKTILANGSYKKINDQYFDYNQYD